MDKKFHEKIHFHQGLENFYGSLESFNPISKNIHERISSGILGSINNDILERYLYEDKRFAHVKLNGDTINIVNSWEKENLAKLNRLLLEDAYPEHIVSKNISEDYLFKETDFESLDNFFVFLKQSEDLISKYISVTSKQKIIKTLNEILSDKEFYSPYLFEKINLSSPTKKLLESLAKLNRRLLEQTYPQHIKVASENLYPIERDDFRSSLEEFFLFIKRAKDLLSKHIATIVSERGAIKSLNDILFDKNFFSLFEDGQGRIRPEQRLRPKTQKLFEEKPQEGEKLMLLNRLLLEDAIPKHIAKFHIPILGEMSPTVPYDVFTYVYVVSDKRGDEEIQIRDAILESLSAYPWIWVAGRKMFLSVTQDITEKDKFYEKWGIPYLRMKISTFAYSGKRKYNTIFVDNFRLKVNEEEVVI